MRRTYTSQTTRQPIEVDDDDAYDAWKDGEITYQGRAWRDDRDDRDDRWER